MKCLARGWVAVHHYRGYRNGVGEAPVYWRMCFGPKRPAGLPRGHEPIPVDDMAALAAYLDAPTPVAV